MTLRSFTPVTALLALGALLPAAPPKKEQPFTPGGKWRAHDMARPRPPVIEPAPVATPAAPPADATVLFGGKDLSAWTREPRRGGDPDPSPEPKWKVENGYMEIVPQSGTLVSKAKFGDAQLHIEWAAPEKVEGDGQGRGNSGVLLQGIGEVQVLDSYQNDTYPDGQAGSIYSNYPPLVNVSRKPGEWQTYDIVIQLARLDETGAVTQPLRLTVFHNGVLVQHASELKSTAKEWGLALQDHLNPVRYRNIWIRPVTYNPEEKVAEVAPTEPSTPKAPPIVPTAGGGLPQGEQLLATLGCASCHSAKGTAPDRFPARKAPILGEKGVRYPATFLREWLADPQHAKPGTTMPDLLHALPAAEKKAVVEDLTHFLVSTQKPAPEPVIAPDEARLLKGRELYHEAGCVACHAPDQPAPGQKAAPDLHADSIPHGELAKKYTVTQLANFLLDPVTCRPSRRMPSLSLKKDEATAIALYLLRAQVGQSKARATASGLRFEQFDGEFSDVGPALAKATPTRTGSIGSVDLGPWIERGPLALRFTGQVQVPTDGRYIFYVESDAGSRLAIDGKPLVDNDGLHPRREKGAAVVLKAGKHDLALAIALNGKTAPWLKLGYEGPGIRKRPIKADILTHEAEVLQPPDDAGFAVDAARAARGRKAFGQLGCISCHEPTGLGKVPGAKFTARPLLELETDKAGACVSAAPGKTAPDFHLSAEQQLALRTALADRAALAKVPTPQQEVVQIMNYLNCYTCHERGGVGGPHDPRATYFQAVGDADLGEEGRIPPHLNGVGAKLRADWLRKVLLSKGTARPYMHTRMPQFGGPITARLSELLPKADNAPAEKEEPLYEAKVARDGHKLIGVGGYACVACHSFGPHPSMGIPAIDLSTVTTRLRPEWFAKYVVDPISLRPGTRMPSFWPGGKAMNQQVLKGSTAKQVDAIWTYLRKGALAEVPAGMVMAKMELVPTTEPIVYRNWVKDAGTRGIAVGYPEKVSLAFDSNELRLAEVWQGAFFDVAKHRVGRNGGFEPPIGTGLTQFPPGVPFATLAQPNAEWPQTAVPNDDVKFIGYTYDKERRPSFRYRLGAVQVEDTLLPATIGEASGFKRTLKFTAETAPEGLHFRVARGKIETEGNQHFLIDGRLRLSFPGAQPFLVGKGEETELRVPIIFHNGQAQLTELISW
jgi:cytochrome c